MDEGLPAAARRLDPLERFGLRTTLLALAVLLVAVPFGLLLEQVTTGGPATRWDTWAAQALNDRFHDDRTAIAVLQVISFTGKPISLVLAVGGLCAWLVRHRAWKLLTFLLVTSCAGAVLDVLVKVGVGRERPLVDDPITSAHGKSFPSGHAMMTVVCFGAMLLVVLPLLAGWRRRAAVASYVGWCLLVGLSRLVLGVHFITDILGGFVLGAAWLAGMVAVFEIWREERGRRPSDLLEEGIEPEEASDLVDA